MTPQEAFLEGVRLSAEYEKAQRRAFTRRYTDRRTREILRGIREPLHPNILIPDTRPSQIGQTIASLDPETRGYVGWSPQELQQRYDQTRLRSTGGPAAGSGPGDLRPPHG